MGLSTEEAQVVAVLFAGEERAFGFLRFMAGSHERKRARAVVQGPFGRVPW